MTEASEERVYEWEVAQVGDQAPPYRYEVSEENIADYCRAVGYENPVYINEGTARAMGFPGLFAPPTMLYTYAPHRRSDLMAARGYIAPEQSAENPRSTPFVATEIRFQGGLVRPEDVITSTTRVADKYERQGNKYVTFQVTAQNQRGESVADYTYTCLWEYAKGQRVRESQAAEGGQG